jgi:hypothetical protein
MGGYLACGVNNFLVGTAVLKEEKKKQRSYHAIYHG